MKRVNPFLICLVIAGSIFWACSKPNPCIVVKTGLGDFKVEIFEKAAPITAANFFRYIDEGLFKDAVFYRTVTMDNQPDNDVKIEVIQGGQWRRDEEEGNGFPAIVHETTDQTGVLHKDGVISMARNQPGSATSEFFICVGDQPELDFGGKRNPDGQGFSAFGRVIDGMDVVRQIHQKPAEGQGLTPHIQIHNIERDG